MDDSTAEKEGSRRSCVVMSVTGEQGKESKCVIREQGEESEWGTGEQEEGSERVTGEQGKGSEWVIRRKKAASG